MLLPCFSNRLAVVVCCLLTWIHIGESLFSNTTLDFRTTSNTSVALATTILSSTPALSSSIPSTQTSGVDSLLESTGNPSANTDSTQDQAPRFTSTTSIVLDLKVPTFVNTSLGSNVSQAPAFLAATEINSPTSVQTNATLVQNTTTTTPLTTKSFENDGQSNQTTSRLNSTITQWLNITSTKPLVVKTTKTTLDYYASWASKCTVEQYPTDFPVAYYPENLECGIPRQDVWERDEYLDRCLARWCSMSLWDLETRIWSTHVPIFTQETFVDQASWLYTVYKTTLTASDESPIDYYIYMSEEAFTYTLPIVANPTASLLVPSKPCCGQCAIQVDQLHIFYWPDMAGEWGSVTSFPTLSIPKGTGKLVPPISRIIITEIDTYIETVNGEVITRLSTRDPDEIVEVINGTTITTLGGDPRTRTSIQKRDIDGNSSVFSIVDENGFTFISPSVYIAFTSLAATDSCGPVGNVPVTTTLALDPDEISTLSYLAHTDKYCGYLTFTKPMTWSDLLRDCATIRPGLVYNPDWTDNWQFTEDRCHPYIMIPTRLRAEHPEWDSCTASYAGGLHDPPRTLRAGATLVPTASQPIVTESAAPGPKSGDPIVTPTQVITKVPGEPQITPLPRPPNPVISVVQPPTLIIGTDGVPSPVVSEVRPPPVVINPVPIISGSRIPPIVVDPDPIVIGSRLPPIVIDPVPVASGVRPPPLVLGPDNTPLPLSPGGRVPTITTTRVIGGEFIPGPGNVQSPAVSAAPILTLEGITVGIDQGTRVVVGGDVLTPGIAITAGATAQTLANGVVTTIEGHTFSLDPAGSRLAIDGTRSIDLPSLTAAQGAMLVIGDTIITLSYGLSSIVGGTTTIAPILIDRNNIIRYAVDVAGTTSYLRLEQISQLGGHFLGSATVMVFPVTKPAATVTLFDGEVLIFAPHTTLITATVAGGADRLAFLVGGHTFTLRDGRVTVLGGATATAFLGPASVAATTSIESFGGYEKKGGSTLSTSPVTSTPQAGSPGSSGTTPRSTAASSGGRRGVQIPNFIKALSLNLFR